MHRLYSRATQQFSSLENIGSAQIDDDVYLDRLGRSDDRRKAITGADCSAMICRPATR